MSPPGRLSPLKQGRDNRGLCYRVERFHVRLLHKDIEITRASAAHPASPSPDRRMRVPVLTPQGCSHSAREIFLFAALTMAGFAWVFNDLTGTEQVGRYVQP